MEDDLTNQEWAILLATRASENAQSLSELAQNVEALISVAAETIDSLVTRKILKEIDSFDGIRYCYAENDCAQRIYLLVHQ